MIIGSITNALASARLRVLMLRLLGELRTQRGNPAPGHLNCDEQRHRFQRPRNDRPPGEAGGQPQTPGTGKPEEVKDLFRGEGKKWKISHPGLELFRKRVYILRLTLL